MTPNDKLKAQQKKNGLAGFKVDLWNYEGEKGALIPLLQAAQDTYGYIPVSGHRPDQRDRGHPGRRDLRRDHVLLAVPPQAAGKIS